MTERWEPIPGWPGYEASDLGRIKSVARVVVRGAGIRQPVRERILKPSKDKHGRLRISFSGRSTKLLSHLVLEAFVGPCPPGMESLHWDDDPSNNRIENLRWGTRTENLLDRTRNGRQRWSHHTECRFGHDLTDASNIIWHGPGKRWRRCKLCDQARRLRK